MPSLFASEKEMQAWISKEVDSKSALSHLIQNAEYLKTSHPTSAGERRVLESYRACYSSLHVLEPFSEDENISLNDEDVLRPDFVFYATETQSIVIVELKNIAAPTRQAGTELSAYAAAMRAFVPFIADGDIVNVVISAEWPALLRHCVLHEIYWQRRNVLCLRPVKAGNSIGLEIVEAAVLAGTQEALKIAPGHLGGYQICLYDPTLKQSTGECRLHKHVEQLKAALRAMAVEGAALRSHGFAFLWRDLWKQSQAPYSITVLNFAPFQSVERFLHTDHGGDIPDMIERAIQLVKDFCPEGHGTTLLSITDRCCTILGDICAPRPEGFTNWGPLRKILDERADLIAFEGWGLFGEQFFEKLKEQYDSGNLHFSSTDPALGLDVIDGMIDESYPLIDLAYYDVTGEDVGDP